jgi:hypothetical protein
VGRLGELKSALEPDFTRVPQAVLHKDQLLTPQLTTSFRKLGKKKMQGSIHSNETAREQGRPSTPLPEGMYPIGVSFLDMGG